MNSRAVLVKRYQIGRDIKGQSFHWLMYGWVPTTRS